MSDKTGIMEQLSQDQYVSTQRHNAITLFRLLLEEEGTDADINDLVTRESLFQLVLHTVDHAKTVRAKVNSAKSNLVSIKARKEKIALLHQWLDQHIGKYKGKLDLCADHASKQILGLGRGFTWCREEITNYRKLKKRGC